MENISLEHKIALGQIPGIGDIGARKLVSYLGSVEAVFREPYSTMIKIPGIGEVLARSICSKNYLDTAKKEAEFVARYGIKTYFYKDDDYPLRLRNCEDSPVVFFYKGNGNLDSEKILSIVGTRNATRRGKEICETIIRDLAGNHPDLVIVSGLAFGIDITAHRSALNHGLSTVGVLGHGLKTIYPQPHRSVAGQMLDKGGLVSDFLSWKGPDRNNFIKRNRIIAGLSDATLVVESAIKGGALISADIAASYNRDVMAIPGRVGDQWSAGCNALIRYNKAALVENAGDIEYIIDWIPEKKEKNAGTRLSLIDFNPREQEILKVITEQEEADIDTICRLTSIPVFRLSHILLEMELKGILQFSPGNIYRISQ